MKEQPRQDLRVKDLLFMSFRVVNDREFDVLSIMSIEQNTKSVYESIKSDGNKVNYIDGELTQVQQKLQIIETKINQLLDNKINNHPAQRVLTDISASGIQFESNQNLKEGDNIEIEITFPHNLMIPIKLIASVIRIENNKTAAKFVFRGVEEEEIITKYVFMKNRKEIQIKKNKRARNLS